MSKLVETAFSRQNFQSLKALTNNSLVAMIKSYFSEVLKTQQYCPDLPCCLVVNAIKLNKGHEDILPKYIAKKEGKEQSHDN